MLSGGLSSADTIGGQVCSAEQGHSGHSHTRRRVYDPLSWLPFWVKAWLIWMTLLNWSAVFFSYHYTRIAGAILATWMCHLALQAYLHGLFRGVVKLIALSRAIFWSPLYLYLVLTYRDYFRDGHIAIPTGSWFSWYFMVLMTTMTVSLVLDWFLVISFMLGFKGVVYTTGGPVAYPAHIQNIKGLEATPACFSRLCSRAKGNKELSRGD